MFNGPQDLTLCPGIESWIDLWKLFCKESCYLLKTYKPLNHHLYYFGRTLGNETQQLVKVLCSY